MDLETLAPEGMLALCLRAEEVCLKRVREIRRQSDPADPSLGRLLADLERQNRLHLDEVAHLGPAPAQGAADVAPYFPSVRERLGEAPLTRDSAMYLVESLKEEASRFFQRMASFTMDEDARTVYTHIALDEIGQVARLRSVIL